MFFVYVLESEIDKQFYIGFTESLDERIVVQKIRGVEQSEP